MTFEAWFYRFAFAAGRAIATVGIAIEIWSLKKRAEALEL